jgi:hypothetical protein
VVCVWHSHLLCLLNYVDNRIAAEGMKHLSGPGAREATEQLEPRGYVIELSGMVEWYGWFVCGILTCSIC